MSTILIIIVVMLGVILLIVFAKSAEREANRITHEANFRIDSLNSLIESVKFFPGENETEVVKLERRAARLKARAEEVASRQAPMWKAYSKTAQKRR